MTKTGFRAVIVDDEALAVEGVRRLCLSSGLVSIVGEAFDGPSGLDQIAKTAPHAVFLDIAMPGMSGLEVAAALQAQARSSPKPHIVLVTANDHFATEAFDLAVVDYVLKPIEPDRLQRAIERVAALVALERQDREGDSALWVPYRGTVIRLPISDIRRIDAERDYVRIHDAERSYLLRATLSDLADRLATFGLIRIHRSTAIARDQIAGLRHVGGGSWAVIDQAGREASVGRTYLSIIRAELLDADTRPHGQIA